MIQKFLELLMMLYLNLRVIITEEAHNHTILDFHKKDIPITNHLQQLGNITLIQEFMDLSIMLGQTYLVIITEEAHNLGTLMIIQKDHTQLDMVKNSVMVDIQQEDLMFTDMLVVILVNSISLSVKIKIFQMMK